MHWRLITQSLLCSSCVIVSHDTHLFVLPEQLTSCPAARQIVAVTIIAFPGLLVCLVAPYPAAWVRRVCRTACLTSRLANPFKDLAPVSREHLDVHVPRHYKVIQWGHDNGCWPPSLQTLHGSCRWAIVRRCILPKFVGYKLNVIQRFQFWLLSQINDHPYV